MDLFQADRPGDLKERQHKLLNFNFGPAYPIGVFSSGVRNISRVIARGYETFWRLACRGTKKGLQKKGYEKPAIRSIFKKSNIMS